jgi:hypothetical protein
VSTNLIAAREALEQAGVPSHLHGRNLTLQKTWQVVFEPADSGLTIGLRIPCTTPYDAVVCAQRVQPAVDLRLPESTPTVVGAHAAFVVLSTRLKGAACSAVGVEAAFNRLLELGAMALGHKAHVEHHR